MKREVRLTADGSHTIAIPQLNITYHSTHGAVQESLHVFIKAGLQYALSKFSNNGSTPLRIFEMGFGTGLNALLSLTAAKQLDTPLYYQAVERYPLTAGEASKLNYTTFLGDESLTQPFLQMHQCPPDKDTAITPFFTLHKCETSLHNIIPAQPFHLIYFDAFALDIQPELWSPSVFHQMFTMLYDGGALVTYSSKGSVRRTLQAAGFMVDKLKGPPGKREIVRALKTGAGSKPLIIHNT